VSGAQFRLGELYDYGQGMPQDYSQAVLWFRKSAQQGNAFAQFDLAARYSHGEGGVPKDDAQAALWLRKAAEQGLADAQYILGVSYYLGQGVPQDYGEAYFWLDLSATGKLEKSKPEDAAKGRDFAASHLTNTVLLQTQERARKWFEDHPGRPNPLN
jgi:hypothetical protein